MTAESARAALARTRFTDLRWLDETTSTNDVASEAAEAGGDEGVVVVADHQRAGRGRRGRTWEAPPGSSLLVSVVLRPPWPPEQAHVATLAMALATVAACAATAGVDAGIKWPNDVVSTGAGGEAKLGGILAERRGGAVVVGLGLNRAWPSPPPAGGVTLAQLAPGRPVERDDLLVAVLVHLDGLLDQPPARLVEAAAARSVTLGRAVRVDLGSSVIEGRAARLSPEGHLVVEGPGGEQVVAAGDVVHLRA